MWGGGRSTAEIGRWVDKGRLPLQHYKLKNGFAYEAKIGGGTIMGGLTPREKTESPFLAGFLGVSNESPVFAKCAGGL